MYVISIESQKSLEQPPFLGSYLFFQKGKREEEIGSKDARMGENWTSRSACVLIIVRFLGVSHFLP